MPTTKDHQGEGQDKASSLRNFWRGLLIAVAVVILILCLAALFIPTLDGPNSRRTANEAVTVGNLRRITALQNDYAASHQPSAPSRDAFDSNAFLLSGERVGYRNAFAGCEPEPNSVVTRYRITAVPLEPRKSGVRAFCTDEDWCALV